MSERIRPDREHLPSPGGGGDIFNSGPGTGPTVHLSSGPYDEHLPVGNMSVGEIRRRFGDRFDVDPESQAVLDGENVSDDVVVRPGQALRFVRQSGEKGNENLQSMIQFLGDGPFGRRKRRRVESGSVTIEGTEATALSPEGNSATMPLEKLLAQLTPQGTGTGEIILPDGVKGISGNGRVTVWIHETPPSVHLLRWIAADSPAPYGSDADYRTVRLSLPYLIIFCVFEPGPGGVPVLGDTNECFFRNAPLKSFKDELHYPALLNCSRFDPPNGRPLSWICTQYLKRDRELMTAKDPSERFRRSFTALKHCLLETGFNYSSEHHEISSWFSESRGVDPRISTVEAWEQASAKDPLFALDVPWLPTNHSVKQAVERIFENNPRNGRRPFTAGTIARLIFNAAQQSPNGDQKQLNLAHSQ